jgi:hypothetical protein
MPSRSGPVTPSRFKARLPDGQHAHAFKVAFGSNAAAAKILRVSRTTIHRWCHDRSPLPREAAQIVDQFLRSRLADVITAQTHTRLYLDRPLPPLRKLSGCCAGRTRRLKRIPQTAAEWAALGY